MSIDLLSHLVYANAFLATWAQIFINRRRVYLPTGFCTGLMRGRLLSTGLKLRQTIIRCLCFSLKVSAAGMTTSANALQYVKIGISLATKLIKLI